MAATKKYGSTEQYEKKLKKVMERLHVEEGKYNWDYSRMGAWIEFTYKGELYRFEHSIENAKRNGQDIVYGSDAFAQLVLALEDLARIVERGIYDLQNWVAGMKKLPAKADIPSFCGVLGLDHVPADREEVHTAFRRMSKITHTDTDEGNTEAFQKLNQAKEDALAFLDPGK